jgi:site-specific DNA recombinase
MKKTPKPVRCAIYTRKSTEEGLDREFTSLDAQREAAEAYIKSQAASGWVALPQRYDDGGFSGANLERPALQRLLADIEAGLVDCVVLHKVDRLSRSLLDFARLMETFDKKRVAFVSVTQQLNSATSMGRLVLNVLLSFAQFEREIIAERTKDKIAAARRKGKWVGGMPLLGYDVDPRDSKLVVNPQEAERVRAIFALYLKYQGLVKLAAELDKRGWQTKRWQTRKGAFRGGLPFTKTNLHHLLTNVVYLGKVRYKQEVHGGEHEAIVERKVFERVQASLRRQGRRKLVRQQSCALLKGLLRCRPCGCSMSPTHSQKNGRRYRYYVCLNACKRGRQVCPSKALPAALIEDWVVEQVRKHAGPEEGNGAEWVRSRIERVDYHGSHGKVSIQLHAQGQHTERLSTEDKP